MSRILQKKFIATAMIAISVLLLVLLGTINVINAWSSEKQSDQMLEMLLEKELSSGPQKPLELREEKGKKMEKGDKEGGRSFLDLPMTENSAMSAVYFWVLEDSSGTVLQTDISRIASVTEEEAEAFALQVYEKSKESGRISYYKYKTGLVSNGKDRIVLFLDTSAQAASVFRVLILSCLAGMACWCLMLLFVILLSQKAIRPIAANMERQKQFITDAGHEIKTPLAIILANTDAMELHNGASKWSKNIRAQTVRLNGLMQNLLTVAKLDESGLDLHKEEIDFSGLAEDSLAGFEEPAALKQIRIEKEIQPGIMLRAEKNYMGQMISILLDNAVKYTPAGGRIVISLQNRQRSILLQVKNTCEKQTETDPSKLFDRFYRGDRARTQKNGGYGIGLSAAKAIAELHKGSITAE